VIYKCHPQFATFDLTRRYGLLDVGDKSSRWFPPAGQFPSQRINPSGHLRSVWIVEALSVKVPRKSWPRLSLPHESPFLFNCGNLNVLSLDSLRGMNETYSEG
jgi:hypothetical protein